MSEVRKLVTYNQGKNQLGAITSASAPVGHTLGWAEINDGWDISFNGSVFRPAADTDHSWMYSGDIYSMTEDGEDSVQVGRDACEIVVLLNGKSGDLRAAVLPNPSLAVFPSSGYGKELEGVLSDGEVQPVNFVTFRLDNASGVLVSYSDNAGELTNETAPVRWAGSAGALFSGLPGIRNAAYTEAYWWGCTISSGLLASVKTNLTALVAS